MHTPKVLERRETRKVGQREEKRTREAGTKTLRQRCQLASPNDNAGEARWNNDFQSSREKSLRPGSTHICFTKQTLGIYPLGEHLS